LKNTQKNLSFSENGNFNYRSDLFDIGVNFSLYYNANSNSIRPKDDQTTFTYGTGGYTTWYLPHNLTIDSDISWTKRTGFTSANYNTAETMWNAAATKQLFSKKYGTGSLKLQFYDILHNRSNVSSSTSTNGFSNSQFNMIPTFFMCSFIYKFSVFPKSSSATESDLQGGRRWGGPGGRPGGRSGGPDGPF
jgi:hypothetical protein